MSNEIFSILSSDGDVSTNKEVLPALPVFSSRQSTALII
jgi:hypothetical protein